MRFPPAIHYPPQPQGTRPPRPHMPYIPSTSPVGAPILPPLGPPSYHYPPPPVPYNRSQQFPPFSTPVSPYIHPQPASDWAPIPFQRPLPRPNKVIPPFQILRSPRPRFRLFLRFTPNPLRVVQRLHHSSSRSSEHARGGPSNSGACSHLHPSPRTKNDRLTFPRDRPPRQLFSLPPPPLMTPVLDPSYL
jgi:hypothetical protein